MPPNQSLLRDLSRNFLPAVRTRGEQYQQQGRVTALAPADGGLEGTVRGTELYRIFLGSDSDGVFDFSCTCPYGDGCKHVWAALREAERNGLLPVINAAMLSAMDQRPAEPPPTRRVPNPPAVAPWKYWLDSLAVRAAARQSLVRQTAAPNATEQRLIYQVGPPGLTLKVLSQARKKTGDWAAPRICGVGGPAWAALAGPADVEIGQLLLGASFGGPATHYAPPAQFALAPAAAPVTLERIAQTGRGLVHQTANGIDQELHWDDGAEWTLGLTIVPDPESGGYRLEGAMTRGSERIILSPAVMVTDSIFIAGGRAARWTGGLATDLAGSLAAGIEVAAPKDQVGDLIAALYQIPNLPPLTWPDEIGVEVVHGAPTPHLRLAASRRNAWRPDGMTAEVAFEYGGQTVSHQAESRGAPIRTGNRIIRRDSVAEAAAIDRLLRSGGRWEYDFQLAKQRLTFAPPAVPTLVPALLADGWVVEVAGERYRTPGASQASVSSGIDWFELEGYVDYGDTRVALPELLAAVRRGDGFVSLGTGGRGVIPLQWLERLGPLIEIGAGPQGRIRFARAQVAILDALLAAMPEVDVDRRFQRARQQLASFAGVKPMAPPRTFRGTLRAYQQEGLGWLEFLRQFEFGGCLADDMGLGKTVQVLALLERRRQAGAPPSLAVVPRSLVFNWQHEAAHFTPKLKVLDHSGGGRRKALDHFGDHHLILTTYGTLRRRVVQGPPVRLCHPRRSPSHQESGERLGQGRPAAPSEPSTGPHRDPDRKPPR